MTTTTLALMMNSAGERLSSVAQSHVAMHQKLFAQALGHAMPLQILQTVAVSLQTCSADHCILAKWFWIQPIKATCVQYCAKPRCNSQPEAAAFSSHRPPAILSLCHTSEDTISSSQGLCTHYHTSPSEQQHKPAQRVAILSTQTTAWSDHTR